MNYFFRKVLKPYIISNRYKNICEIGASEGDNTEKLLKIKGLCITVIDPCIDKDLVAHYRAKDCVKIMKGTSLSMLPRIHAPFDCILIDGDHNWYTVFNELKAIHKRGLLRKGGTIFLHDMLWPCARRDQYYVPETIPAEFRHPHAKKGVGRHEPGLLDRGGANPHIYNACFEGGPRNGVLTAVEDFLKEFGKEYIFFYHRAEYGLGFLIKKEGAGSLITALAWRARTRRYELQLAVKTFLRKIYKKKR